MSHITKEEYFCLELGLEMECAKVSESGRTCYPHFDDYKSKKLCPTPWIIGGLEDDKVSFEEISIVDFCVSKCVKENDSDFVKREFLRACEDVYFLGGEEAVNELVVGVCYVVS